MKRQTIFAALLLAATMGMYAQKAMKAPKGGKAISDELIGIFSRTSALLLMEVSMRNSSRMVRSSIHLPSVTDGAQVLLGE